MIRIGSEWIPIQDICSDSQGKFRQMYFRIFHRIVLQILKNVNEIFENFCPIRKSMTNRKFSKTNFFRAGWRDIPFIFRDILQRYPEYFKYLSKILFLKNCKNEKQSNLNKNKINAFVFLQIWSFLILETFYVVSENFGNLFLMLIFEFNFDLFNLFNQFFN